jgi:CheY-like chemotaxis protein
MGRGTGLGLATVYGIVQGHKGFIQVQSEEGQGTTFEILLPATEKSVAPEPVVVEAPRKGTGAVLLVDDEQMILSVGERMLEALGYGVILSAGGEEAIRIYEERGSAFDLVILDMIMPGMGGGETFDRLKEINPAVKVLLSSGYAVDGQARAILDRGCDGFIQKPFNLLELSEKIEIVLKR